MLGIRIPKLPKELFSFIWHFIKSYKWGVAGLCLVALLWGIQMSVTPYFLKVILDTSEQVASTSDIVIKALIWPATFYFLISVSPLLIFRFYEFVILKTIPALQRDIWHQMFIYVEQHSFRYFQHHYAGSIANKIADMARSVEIIFTMMTDIFLSHILALIIAGITMYKVHPIFLFTLAIWSVFFLVMSFWLSNRSRHHSVTVSEARSKIMGKVVDSLANISSVRLFCAYRYEERTLKHSLQDTMVKDQKLQWTLLKIKAIQGAAAALFTLSSIIFLVYMRAHNKVTVGDFALIVVLSQSIIDAVWRMADHVVEFNTALGTAQQALSIIEPDIDIIDREDAQPLHIDRGEIVFDKVHFSHLAHQKFFEDKNIRIEAGQKVGLVGLTGSGKTTFVNLILRHFELDAGHILIDGQDIADVTQDSLRKAISLIPQEPILFHRTIWENIQYGHFDATDEEIIEAARKAHCHDFITQLPEGYQTQVGERGIRLSGGQRQRISIARAFLKNSSILILDEATSSLDTYTEKLIQESLKKLMKDQTTLIVSHRLSTLQSMTHLLVFHEGRIVEQGDHKTLLQKNGHYAFLWKIQSGGYLPSRRVSTPFIKKAKAI